MTQQLPVIDDLYLRNVFNTLSQMQVDLDSDPLVFGPKRLNAKVALCREYLSKCQQVYLQLADDLHRLSRAHRQLKLDFDLQVQDLLANDPEVRSQKNIRDREAVASSKLRAERELIFRVETSISDIDSVITVVKTKREDLKDIQGRIRDQVKLCQEEIGLGLKWGSAPPPGTTFALPTHPKVDPRLLEDFQEVVGGIDGESSVEDLEKFVRNEIVSRGERVSEMPSTMVDGFSITDLFQDDALEEVAEVAVLPSEEAAPTVVLLEEAAEAAVLPSEEGAVLPSEEGAVLPTVDSVPVPASSATLSEVENFFNELDALGSAKQKAPAPVDDLDIDDILRAFEM